MSTSVLFRDATASGRAQRRARIEWLARLPTRAGLIAALRAISPVVAFRAIALLLAFIIVSTDLHRSSDLRDDGWLLAFAVAHLAATALAARRLPALPALVNALAIGVDIAVCVALIRLGDGWRGPFWLYGVSAVFWPAYRFGPRGACGSVVAFNLGVLLTSLGDIRATFRVGYGGDLLARLTMVLIIAGAVALTARALQQLEALAAEAERNRIARDLHDGVGKTLGGISLEASSLASWIERDPIEARRRARYVTRVSERAAIEVRDVIRSLRQQQSTAPLLPAVREAVEEWRRSGPEIVRLRLNGPDIETPVLIRGEILRMLNELLDNARRHAHAEQVWVRVTLSKLGVTLAVRDDGVGFDTALVDPWADEGHFGLLGTRERVWMLGGHFQLQATPGGGVQVTVDLPLRPREERAPGLR